MTTPVGVSMAWAESPAGQRNRRPQDLGSHGPLGADVGAHCRPECDACDEPEIHRADGAPERRAGLRENSGKAGLAKTCCLLPDFFAPIGVFDLQNDFEIVGEHPQTRLPRADRCFRAAK